MLLNFENTAPLPPPPNKKGDSRNVKHGGYDAATSPAKGGAGANKVWSNTTEKRYRNDFFTANHQLTQITPDEDPAGGGRRVKKNNATWHV